MYEEFNKFMKNTKTVIYNIFTSESLTTEHKIVICLLMKYITKNEKQ